MSEDVVLFRVGGRMLDAWGNDHGETPKDQPNPRQVMTEATQASNLDSNQNVDDSDDDWDGDLDLDEMTGKQLKAELDRRNTERDEDNQINASGVKKVGELRALLKADNESRQG